MRITIKGKNGTVPESLRQYAEKRVKKLERYFHNIQAVEIAQATERGQHIIELNMEGDGIFLRSEERCNDMHTAVDNAVEKMERQLKRFKTRIRDGHRRPHPVKEGTAEVAANPALPEEAEVETQAPRIVRRKVFVIKPMSSEEAARQMELVDHSFFLFLNEDTGQMNVLYRRRDGNYGLIEPEM